jgi:hypothetical protein
MPRAMAAMTNSAMPAPIPAFAPVDSPSVSAAGELEAEALACEDDPVPVAAGEMYEAGESLFAIWKSWQSTEN